MPLSSAPFAKKRFVEVLGRRMAVIDEGEGDAIVFYFKFPPGFKVHLPAIIGNYNPDWGVARVDRAGRTEVRTFVHETKGTTELSKLQFPNERRKILCAQKFFAVIGVTYLTIDPKKVSGWWEPVTEQSQIE